MNIKNNKLMKAIFLTGMVLGSTTTFAADLVPGVTDPCEQLWLVNDPGNARLEANAGGECIDVPVNLTKVNVLFNLDNAVTKTSPSKNEDGSVSMITDPVGLRHMALLGKVMQYRISQGLIDPKDIAIVGIFHGEAMSAERWPFKTTAPGGGMPANVKIWVDKIFALKNAGINIQLEVCGVTLKGMQKKMKEMMGPSSPWAMLDERAIYSNDDSDGQSFDNGRIYINQGAVGRIIELQTKKFAYLQEE